MKNITTILLISMAIITSCKRDEGISINPEIKLNFSTDSILFDTVFTTIGSTARSIKVFNVSKVNIEISNIRLVGGVNSPFKININGLSQSSVNNIRVDAKDSIYVFIKAVINPTLATTPFLVQDTLEFLTNGNLQKIPLVAYGQNAVYFNAKTINEDFTFKKGIPYLIYKHLKIAQNAKVNIAPGAKLYFHSNAQMMVYGTLQANGSIKDSITFCSDRTERIYRDEPGQWKGVYIGQTSKNNNFNYCTIKNSIVGVQVDSLSTNTNPKLIVTNCIIKNHTLAGIMAYNTQIVAINNLLFNCGKYLVLGLYGGSYLFYHNTLDNSNASFGRQTPSVFFSDNTEDGSLRFNNFELQCINNIIWGNADNEFLVNNKGTKPFISSIKSNLLKATKNYGESNILNTDPFFLDAKKDNYLLTGNSPALNIGTDLSLSPYFNTFIKVDLKNIPRTFPSDVGCYEIK
ncbi:MAG: hypothetical protein EAZ64_08050 [Sphingobacteriales bacterium]|nr:MAG: hypothetical protein EAZ64_08050 [Sphingobacteriales bacterium]